MTTGEGIAAAGLVFSILLNIITLVVFITKLGARLENLTSALKDLTTSVHATAAIVQAHEVRISVIEATKGNNE